jgi:hypothetical protein
MRELKLPAASGLELFVFGTCPQLSGRITMNYLVRTETAFPTPTTTFRIVRHDSYSHQISVRLPRMGGGRFGSLPMYPVSESRFHPAKAHSRWFRRAWTAATEHSTTNRISGVA